MGCTDGAIARISESWGPVMAPPTLAVRKGLCFFLCKMGRTMAAHLSEFSRQLSETVQTPLPWPYHLHHPEPHTPFLSHAKAFRARIQCFPKCFSNNNDMIYWARTRCPSCYGFRDHRAGKKCQHLTHILNDNPGRCLLCFPGEKREDWEVYQLSQSHTFSKRGK